MYNIISFHFEEKASGNGKVYRALLICWFSVWNLRQVYLSDAKNGRWHLDFWGKKICAPSVEHFT